MSDLRDAVYREHLSEDYREGSAERDTPLTDALVALYEAVNAEYPIDDCALDVTQYAWEKGVAEARERITALLAG